MKWTIIHKPTLMSNRCNVLVPLSYLNSEEQIVKSEKKIIHSRFLIVVPEP